MPNQFDKSGGELKAALIMYGSAHCRLEDITSDNRRSRDVEFTVNGKIVKRVKGETTHGMMRSWVQLRSELGDEQFKSLRV